MVQQQTVGFQISGEFITDLVRTWFWDEHRPIQVCMELIDCIVSDTDDDTKEAIFRLVIEGRKKFVGINEFQLVDDNENIRSITSYMAYQEKEKTLAKIKLDMVSSFVKYVDKWATIKSTHPGVLLSHNSPTSYQECVEYFCKEDSYPYVSVEASWLYVKDNKRLIDTRTMGGLWLVNEPETVYEACKGEIHLIGKEEFWKNIYELKKDDPDFADRNERYAYSIRPKPSVEERMKNLMKAYEKERLDETDEPERFTDEWFTYQYEQTKELDYLMEPDFITNWEGLIAPNGDFYSVKFGSHNVKAYYLMVHNPKMFGLKENWFQKDTNIRYDNALDILLEHGWCATRSVMYDSYVLPPSPKQPTKAQIYTILDAADKHSVNIDRETLISYL